MDNYSLLIAHYLSSIMRAAVIVGIVEIGLLCMLVSGCNSSQRTAERYYQGGLQYKEENEFLRAAGQFRLALEQVPQHVDAHLQLGLLLCHDGKFQQGIKHFLKVLEYGGPSQNTYAFMGYAYEQLGRLHLAERFYKRAVREFPEVVDVRLRLADVLELQGKRPETAEVLAEVLTITPDIEHAEMLRARADLLKQPETPDGHLNLADLYIRQGKIDKGVTEYGKAHILHPEDPDALINFGIFCLDREQFATALTYFLRAKHLGRTQQLEVRAGLGIAYEGLGRIEEAIQEYQAALSIQPDWYEIHLKLAELFENVGRPRDAADEFETVFRFSRRADAPVSGMNFPDINLLWSEILRLRGEKTQKAVVVLKRSGQHNLVDVILNHHVPAILMIEEQAQYTIITETLAQKLGIQITPQTSEYHFTYAGRSYTAPLVNLPSLKIGEMEVHNVPTLIWNLSTYPEVDGLLGRSFLKHFQVEIDYADQLFVLTKLYS